MQLDFESAIKKIVSEELKGNNPIPDILGFQHLRTLLGKNYADAMYSIISEYNRNPNNIQPLLKIDVPKANFTLRPMARPETKVWLIYEAIIENIASSILEDNAICPKSYSILTFKRKYPKGIYAWLQFDEKCRSMYNQGYQYAVKTDITAFYENVNLNELKKRVDDFLCRDDENTIYMEILFNLLRKWSDDRIQGYGLPQGPPGSAFLADIYLDYIDHKMHEYEGYLRYMDDIRIFCKNEIEAKLALKDLTLALRSLKLNLNAKKTEFMKKRKIGNDFDPQKQLLNIIESVIKSKNGADIKKIAMPALLDLFKSAFSSDRFEKTHLNFAIPRLGMLYNSSFIFKHQKIIETIQNNFVTKPQYTGLFCDFLSFFPNDNAIPEFLIRFIKSKNNIVNFRTIL